MKKKNTEAPKDVTFYQNPALDILFGSVDSVVPSKKVDFKPIDARLIDEQGDEQILHDIYVKKPSSKSVKDFENLVQRMLKNSPLMEKRISKPGQVEVIIRLSVRKKDFDKVDVDNVAKTILDSIKGYLIDDDSQVARLICEKFIHPLNIPSFLIAITELKPTRNGLFGGYWLYTTNNPAEKDHRSASG